MNSTSSVAAIPTNWMRWPYQSLQKYGTVR